MTPETRDNLEDFDGDSTPGGTRRGVVPELSNRRTRDVHPRRRARRNRTTEVAKRGMHRRRNKRMSW